MPDALDKLRTQLANHDRQLTEDIVTLQDEQDRVRAALKALWYDAPEEQAKVVALPDAGRPQLRQRREVGVVPVDDVLAALSRYEVPIMLNDLAEHLGASRVMLHARLRDLLKEGLVEAMMEGWRITREGRQNWVKYRARELPTVKVS